MKDNILAAIGFAVVALAFPYYLLSLDKPPTHKAPAAVSLAAPSSSPVKAGKGRRGRGVNCECQWTKTSK